MGSHQFNNDYNICTENEVASILSHFNTNFVMDVVRQNLLNRTNNMYTSIPNIVVSYEQNFKDMISKYPQETSQIQEVRIQTYKEIINEICLFYNLQFNTAIIDSIDFYSAAYFIYDFFVSNYANYIVGFYSNYIYSERNAIYDSMNLSALKKNKDSSTIYGKKIYKDIKLAVINANLEFVINNMATFDIPFQTILSFVYADRSTVNYISQIVIPINDFYQTAYITTMKSEASPNILTSIRLEIQKSCIDFNYNGGNENEQ